MTPCFILDYTRDIRISGHFFYHQPHMTDDTNIQFMSQEKLDELNEELKQLKEEKNPQIAKRIDDAKQMGDLSENAEYHSAREDMAWAQSRVKEIQNIISNAQLITTKNNDGEVGIGSTVTVKSGGDRKEYTIVGAQEADPLSGKISNESPLGSAFLGKKKGDRVEAELPAGTQEFKIVNVE